MSRAAILLLMPVLLQAAVFGAEEGPAGEKRPITVEDLWRVKRLGSPALSPDGSLAAVVVTEYDMGENEGRGDIWLVATDGSMVRRLTTGKGSEGSPAWSPDGSRLAFTAKRGSDEKTQLYVIRIAGGEAERVTEMPLGVSGPRWIPGGNGIAFVSPVIPGLESDLDSMKAELERREEEKVSVKVTEDRLYRYWDRWHTDGTVPHLFSIDLDGMTLVDLTPGWDRLFTASGGVTYDISPEGDEIALVAMPHGPPYDSLTTDVYLLPVDDPGHYRNITAANPANDFSPYYTPDGRYILFGRQRIIGFYADRTRLVRYDRRTGEELLLTESLDRSPAGWIADEKAETVYFHAEDRGARSLFSVGIDGGRVREVYRSGTNSLVGEYRKGRLLFMHERTDRPACLCTVRRNGKEFRRLTSFNDELLAGIEFGRLEDVWFTGAEGARVQMFVLYPPGFDPGKRWPLLVLLHGGPHGIFGDDFHPRWNSQVFAAPGYVTAMVNFHGSSSFGQAFTDAITGEVGGKPFTDVMAAVDTLLTLGFIDGERMAVAGGSYGGYLVSWIGTQTDRFACIIDHAGVFDLITQFGSDITFGRERSYGGTPWDDLEAVQRYSPAHHMRDYRTPTLVVHGERDYRVPVGQGLEAYGMLKGRGVPAKLVYFPGENHFVLSPQNSIFWYHEFHAWLARWIGVGPE